MKAEQVFVANLVGVILAMTLLGLVVRRRITLCRSFTVYIAGVFVTDRLAVHWPEQFWTQGFWHGKEFALAGFKLVIAAELAHLIFQALPRARRAAIAFMIAATLVLAAAAASDPVPEGVPALGLAQARIQASAVWAFVMLVLLATWYHLPLHPFHRALLTGFALYLGVYGTLLGLLGSRGVGMYPYFAALDPAAYAATVGLWALAAWRPEEATALTPAARQHLQPWARP